MSVSNKQKAPGDVIKELRLTFGLTQEEFAAKIGITQEMVAGLENNRHKPSYQTLRGIINAFNIDAKIFFPEKKS